MDLDSRPPFSSSYGNSKNEVLNHKQNGHIRGKQTQHEVIRLAESLYSKHGGVHFRKNTDAEAINSYVAKLPDGKKDSLFEVLDELDKAGLISIVNDGQFADGEGNLEGSTDC
jgi:hypothetical protein